MSKIIIMPIPLPLDWWRLLWTTLYGRCNDNPCRKKRRGENEPKNWGRSLWTTSYSVYTHLLLGLLSPPIRTSLDGLVAETNDSAGLDLTAFSIDTFMLLGKVDGGGFREFFFTSVSEGSSVCCNSNSSSVT